jgi:hypothetical protein
MANPAPAPAPGYDRGEPADLAAPPPVKHPQAGTRARRALWKRVLLGAAFWLLVVAIVAATVFVIVWDGWKPGPRA